jgi:hypothetical protein
MSFTGKWLADSAAFRGECLKISQDLTGFKKNPVYCRYINNDNRSRETAEAFYWHIRQHYPWLIAPDLLELFLENDRVGDPTVYNINGIIISPGTLRFIKVLGDIRQTLRLWVPKGNVLFTSIVEIGAGYGGQCKIIKAAFPEVDYTIVDIPESIAVSRAYLGELATLVDDIKTPISADLVISDYCISEMDKAGIDYYIENVVRHCRHGYFTCNLIGEVGYLYARLREIFETVKDTPEEPKTSRHNNIILYAMGNRYL